jgi:hypothetical protein
VWRAGRLHGWPRPARHGIRLEMVKLPEAQGPNCGFVLLPSPWVLARDFASATRFRRLVREYERLAAASAGLPTFPRLHLFDAAPLHLVDVESVTGSRSVGPAIILSRTPARSERLSSASPWPDCDPSVTPLRESETAV